MSKQPIPDGHTRDGYVAEFPGVHPAVRFKYRRIGHLKLAAWRDSSKTEVLAAAAMYELCCRHVESWDLQALDDDGKSKGLAPIKSESLAVESVTLVDKMFNIIAGYRASDVDEKAAPAMDSALTAILEDRTTEAAEKN